MKILISGASGLLGSALSRALSANGHEVTALTRSPSAHCWDPSTGVLRANLSSFDAIIHLAGENIAGGRWNAERKQRIMESRRRGTALLAEGAAAASPRPKILLSASAVGIYGARGDEVLSEESPAGVGFLAEVARNWERAAAPAAAAGIRTVLLRFGVVLDRRGGALRKMLPAFRFGLGGRLGSGRQYMSWIALSDVERVIEFLLAHSEIDGAVNVVAPEAVTNAEFAATLAKVLRRPALLPVPAGLLRLALGDMADEALLASVRAVPGKLLRAGFEFKHAPLEAALRSMLGA